MIIYGSNALEFRNAVESNEIANNIENTFKTVLSRRPSISEKRSWNNSLQFMERIIRNSNVANDCGILIEYNIPCTSRRIDFIISGCDSYNNKNFIIIELKQWEHAESTDKEDLVIIDGKDEPTTHPSYQAWSYKQTLVNMNESIHSGNLNAYSCAYLHNYVEKDAEPLKLGQYNYYLNEAPIFFSKDYLKLQEFLFKYVGNGKGMDIIYQIENGKIKPSKKLIEHIGGLFKGNPEFVLIDEQKVAYETIMSIAKKKGTKRTIIVEGGPGTGKSVVSMNAFGNLIKRGLNVKFVAPNAAFRTVMTEMLAKQNPRDKGKIRNLFTGSGQFFMTKENTFDVLIVDEAHRLKRQGAYQYYGENQIEDIVKAANISVFFIDDTQRIRPEDIGTVVEIGRAAEKFGSKIFKIKLEAQFRCSGAEGFINWMDSVLQIKETANFNGWDKQAFEFQILDTPNKVYEKIEEKVQDGYKARMLAGYAWPWTSEKDGNKNGEICDVEIPEHNFKMPWNGRSISYTWSIEKEGIDQIGCVHTSQGLEFDYVGVIIGNDLKFNVASMELCADYNEYKDSVGKKGLKFNNDKLTELVKNIYKVLISRGMKGCYVFCRDKNLQKYFKDRLKQTN